LSRPSPVTPTLEASTTLNANGLPVGIKTITLNANGLPVGIKTITLNANGLPVGIKQ
jgi:hypothetical protein